MTPPTCRDLEAAAELAGQRRPGEGPFAGWRLTTRRDGSRVLWDPADPSRALYDYGPGEVARYACTGRVTELPPVPYSTNRDREAVNQIENDRQISVIAGAFERARETR